MQKRLVSVAPKLSHYFPRRFSTIIGLLYRRAEILTGGGRVAKIEHEWCEAAGRRYLYARPRTAVNNDDSVGFFETELDGFSDDVFRVLVDVVGVEEDIGIEGFSRISEFLAGLHVRQVSIAVLPANEFYPIIANLIREVASNKGLDARTEIFLQRSAAEAWLGKQ